MNKFTSLFVLPLLLVTCLPAYAQSISVIGGDVFAEECFIASTLAVQLNTASRDDLQNCDKAIQHGQLQRRDLIATLVNRGILYAALEQYKRAAKDYQSAINLDPKSGEAFVNLGNLYFLGRKFDTAIDQYDKAIELELSKDHIAYFNRGMAWENLGDNVKAESDYRQAIQLSPQWAIPQIRLERMLERAKKKVNNG